MGDEAVDFQHLMACTDRYCLYCVGGKRHVTEAERRREEIRSAQTALLWDLGARRGPFEEKRAA